jgi:hypothetical protein
MFEWFSSLVLAILKLFNICAIAELLGTYHSFLISPASKKNTRNSNYLLQVSTSTKRYEHTTRAIVTK